MKAGARVAAAIEVWEQLDAALREGGRKPADVVLGKYFRQRRFIGSKDRREISRQVYGVLRHERALAWWLKRDGLGGSPRAVVLSGLVLLDGLGLEELSGLFNGDSYCPSPLVDAETAWVKLHAGEPLLHEAMPEPVRFNYPDWMQPALRELFGEQLAEAMAASNAEAPVDLRVNTLKATREEVLAALKAEGLDPVPMERSADGVRLSQRAVLPVTRAFRDGWIEVQDEGSQLVAQLVNAQPGELGIDFCAGAGGKTLALAAAMENRGRILAWDVAELRFKKMKPRLVRAGADNVQRRLLTSEEDPFIDQFREAADWVLVDAPCTGTGIWRRSPDLRRRTSESDLVEAVEQQRKILGSAARLVKPGGRLVYATCSIFRVENERQREWFLASQPGFEGGDMLRLFPHEHGTDGFFGAVLERVS
jgi:16S rRNA (cytosine967-C5)-methyltransferase